MRKTKKIAITILLLLIVQLFSGYGKESVAKAEENNQFKFITSIELTDFSGNPLGDGIDKSSEVRVKFNFDIPNIEDIKIGDVFTVTIPDQLDLISDFDQDIYDDDGNLVAIAHFKKGGKIDVEFTDYTGSYSNIGGNFYLDTKFNRNNIGNDESEKLQFTFSGESEPIEVEVKFKQDPVPEPSISKWSSGYDGSKNEITWYIEFNKENANVNSARIIDNIPFGQEYIQGSATIDNGANISGFTYVSSEDNSDYSGTLTYTFQGQVNTKHIISFKTRISDASILPKEQGESVKLYNKASVDINGQIKESNEASVDVKTNYIEKFGNYNSNEKKIDWTIKVNNNALELNNLKVEDIIPEGLELIKDSFKVNNEVNNNYNYDEVNKKLDYTFNGTINTQQIITYSTKVVDEKVYQSNDSTNFKNTATIVEGLEGNPHSDATVGVGSNILKKSGVGYEASSHYITWRIEVNNNEVELQNPLITDNIPIGQKYVNGSFKIDGEDADTSKFNYEAAQELDKEKTGVITYSFNETINKKYVITFETEITDSSIYAGNVNGKQYTNTVTINAENISNEVNSTGYQNVTSNVINKQSVNYDAVSKEITWKIFVNKNKTKLGQVVVTDNINIGQEYVEGSATIDNNADNNGFSYIEADKNDKDKTGTLIYTFKDEINDTYEITFKTKIIDESIFYTNGEKLVNNKAQITGDVIPPNVVTESSTKIENSVIKKSANYENGKDYIDWNVIINSNSISMGKVTIEDDLQEGLELDTTSVELYKQTLNTNGTLVKGEAIELNENSVKYDANTRKFIFNFSEEVNSPYVLTFRTNIVDKSKQPFTNKVYFKGEKTSENSTSDYVNVEFQSGGGSAVGTRGSITIKKVDKENNEKMLKGAKFNLIDRYKNVIATGETDDNGALTFNKIKFDIPYYLEEVEAPEGYVLNENNIHEFMIKSSDDSKNIIRTFENSIIKASLELLKLDQNENPLKGAEFTVYDLDNNEVTKGTTDENGVVKFKDLVYGNYYYVETKAPEGYVKDNNKHDFTINENGVVLKETVENEKIVGNINVVKVDEEGNVLPNAEFTLYDLEGNMIQTGVTNENGLVTFTNIPYGEYEIKETKAPVGYNLSSEVLNVSVNGKETGLTYEAGKITNTQIKGNIKIRKIDQDGNKVVRAEFTLYNKDNKAISTVETNKDGVALFENIVYGEYYILETKTPEGYIASDKKVDVNVKENNKEYGYEIENTRIKGGLEISKIDQEDNALAGAEFTIYDSDDKKVTKGTTDENGVVKFEELVYGNYYYIETKAPEGYVKDNNKHNFTINENGVVLKETVENEKIVGNINVVKVDEEGNVLPNAEFTLYDLEGNMIQTGVTNENGLVTFTNIPYGEYEIKETKAPVGYNLSSEILNVSVNGEETGLTYEIGKITNTQIKRNIKISKIDQDGNKVVGAEFTLYNKDNESIETDLTNEEGIALFEDVIYGEYYIMETKTPEGYIGTKEKIEVSIKENGSDYFYQVENTRIKGTLEIKKIDESGNILKGAEFTLYDKDGKEISKNISDDNGIARFDSVDYGTYVLKETKAPEGYKKDDTVFEIVVDSSITQKFTFKNYKINDEENNINTSDSENNLPSTGDTFDSRAFILVGLAFIFLGSGFLLKKKVNFK
ncbi:SpaA isopeptide-forming pilin-related protein [Clostridium nigeriense]|uniref:SpaA isopeptide-forming pilin-related protein n=1 Tax=Clostridium nigeriense TaxID=1805470 RepID=UPI003D33F4B8